MNQEEGFIKIHRKMLEWEWYDDINTKVLFLHLLLKVNHKEKKWRGITVFPGEMITWLHALSTQTGLSIKQVRTALNKLKRTDEVAIKSTNNYSIIKVKNWDKHQTKGKPKDKQRANERQAKGNKQEWKESKLYKYNLQLQELWFSKKFFDFFSLYEKHRKQKKSSLTDIACERILKKCAAAGEEKSIAAIQNSIDNGWTGIFFEKTPEKISQNREDFTF